MTIITTKFGLASVDSAGPVKIATVAETLAGTSTTLAVSPAGVKAQFDALVDGAPDLLNTLNELANAIGDDANFVTTITAVTDDHETRISDLENGIAVPPGTPSQAELDDTQAGAGLAADGSYVADATTNYITAATSLFDADKKLDAQIKLNATAISNLGAGNIASLQTEVDETQSSLGLNADGTKSNFASANYIVATGTFQAAIEALDAQLKSTQDDLDSAELDIADHETRITTLEAGGGAAAVQSELDDTQLGAGLAADGSYAANAGSNYISAATSLKDADDKLDAQIKTNADAIALKASQADLDSAEADIADHETRITTLEGAGSIAALQTEVDATQTGVGLNANGTFNAPSGSNYIDASTSVMDALDKLDTQIKANADGHTDITALTARVATNETDIASLQTADTTLQSNIDAVEVGAGLDADGGYTADGGSNYISGVSSLKAADSALDAQIKTNADAIALKASSAAVTTLTGRVTTNENDIAQIETDLASKLEAGDIAGLQTEIDAIETAAGFNANGTYSAHSGSNYIDGATSTKSALGLLDAEISTNATDITNLTATVNTLSTAGSANATEITALENEINATQTGAGLSTTGAYTAPGASNYLGAATSLKDADNKLDAAIKDRKDEIDALDVRVTANEGDITSLEAADVTLQSNIDDKADQTSLDSTNNELGTTQTSIGLNANGTYSAHSGSNYIDGAATVKGALTLLDSQIKTNEDDIATNSGLITNNANAIASNDTDISNLQSADTTLQSNIDAVEVGAGLDADGGYTADATTNYLTAASSLKDADKKLDAQVKTNASAIALKASQADLATLTGRVTTAEGDITSLEGRMDTAETDITALETLADTHETSLGLNADGSRPAYSSSNYVSGTHHNALGQLDSQVKTNADAIASNDTDITALQTLADTHESSIGLTAAGAYQAPAGSNYLGAASSVRDADSKLDAQIKTNADAISTETTNRSNADTALQTEIDAIETGAGLNADGSYTAIAGNYATGASLKAAITQLDTQLKSTQDDLDTAEAAATTLAGRVTTAEGDITSLETLADTHETAIGLNADGTYTAIVGANYATDNVLKAAVGSLDSQVKTNADAIALRATSATVSALQTEVDAIETAAGLNADGTFNGFTTTNYLNASTSLRGALSDLDGQVKTNADGIAAEITNRSNADAALQTELDATQTGAGLAANGSYTTPAGNTYLGGASLKADIANLDTQLASTQSDLDTAEAALSTAQSDISDLETLADTHETAIGLNANGTYNGFTGSTYLDASTSIRDALSKLDVAVNSVDAGGVADLQTEVDAIETAVGLSAAGAYVSRSGSNYLDSETSIAGEIGELDSQVKLREDEITAVEDRATELEKRDGGIFIDAAAGKVEMDSTLSQYQSFTGPFQVSLIDLINTGNTDIVYYGATAPRLSDKHFVVTADGNVEFVG